MWIAVLLYVFLLPNVFFIDSPPALTQEGCLEMLAGASRQLASTLLLSLLTVSAFRCESKKVSRYRIMG